MKQLFFSLAVTVLIASGACSNSGSRNRTTGTTATSSEVKSHDVHATLKVGGACEMCKSRIEKAAKDVAGVSSASWDSDKKELHFHYDSAKTSVDAVSKALAKVGHDTDKDKATDEVYNALPGCCKYRS
jgi:Cu(I)/Ag(I) efflux system membrane fusion protein